MEPLQDRRPMHQNNNVTDIESTYDPKEISGPWAEGSSSNSKVMLFQSVS